MVKCRDQNFYFSAVKKVLIITYYWPPSGGAGVQRWLKFSKYLPEYGWEPTILTVDPKYATYPVSDESLTHLVPENIKVIRTKSWEPLRVFGAMFGQKKIPYGGFANVETDSLFSKITRWIRGNFFIPDARKGWNHYAFKAAKTIINEEKVTTIISTGPPHSTHLIGLKLKTKVGVKWIADFRDPWSGIYYNDRLYKSSFASSLDKQLELKVLQKADLCIVASPSFAKDFNQSFNRKYTVITNGYDSPGRDVSHGDKVDSRKFTISYVGTLAESYSPRQFFQALLEDNADFNFQFAGKLSPNIEVEILSSKLSTHFINLGYVTSDIAFGIMSESDLLVLILPAGRHNRGIIPGKLFEYMNSKTPILAMAEPESEVARILSETGAGKSFSHEDKEGFKDYLRQIRAGDVPARNDKLIENYSVRILTAELSKLL